MPLRTLVATWDLSEPSESESTKVIRLHRGFESLGPNGDERVKVPGHDFGPGGRYGAICKLFMSYSNRPNEEYVTTGWLIRNDLIVTAGHCVYETGGLLRYIKGIAVAALAEYFKVQTYAHDVGFIRLNQPIDNIEPVRYSETPLKASASLGLVDYPQERDSGHYMYQHWETVPINLAETGMLLNCKIDTTGGQSGSPVFMNGQAAVGVHVAGGYPNYGSVIGQAGNNFKAYILALKVKDGYRSAIVVPSGKVLALGFQMIRIGNKAKIDDQQLDRTLHPNSMPAAETAPPFSSGDDSSASNLEIDDDDDDDDHDDDDGRSPAEPGKQTIDKTTVKSAEKCWRYELRGAEE